MQRHAIRSDSPHRTAADTRDLSAITETTATALRVEAMTLTVDRLTAPVLRDAFVTVAVGHAKTSITRCWSAWNQFLNRASDRGAVHSGSGCRRAQRLVRCGVVRVPPLSARTAQL